MAQGHPLPPPPPEEWADDLKPSENQATELYACWPLSWRKFLISIFESKGYNESFQTFLSRNFNAHTAIEVQSHSV